MTVIQGDFTASVDNVSADITPVLRSVSGEFVSGEKGESGGSYIHLQGLPSSLWTVVHNLGYKPGGIMVLDSANEEWKGKVEHINDNSLTISFGIASFSGKAYLS